jgi:hypothetical protein
VLVRADLYDLLRKHFCDGVTLFRERKLNGRGVLKGRNQQSRAQRVLARRHSTLHGDLPVRRDVGVALAADGADKLVFATSEMKRTCIRQPK